MGWAPPNTMCKAVTDHLFPHPQTYFGWCGCLASPCSPDLHSWGGGSESLWSYPLEVRPAALKWRCLRGIPPSCADGLSHSSASVVTPHLWSLGRRCMSSLAAAIPVALYTMYIYILQSNDSERGFSEPQARIPVGCVAQPARPLPTAEAPLEDRPWTLAVLSPRLGLQPCSQCPGQSSCTGFSGQSRNFLHGQQQTCCLVNYCTVTRWGGLTLKPSCGRIKWYV